MSELLRTFFLVFLAFWGTRSKIVAEDAVFFLSTMLKIRQFYLNKCIFPGKK
jgi:hypothetical protein